MITLILDYQKNYPTNCLGIQALSRSGVAVQDIDVSYSHSDVDTYLHTVVEYLGRYPSLDRVFIPASLGPVFSDYLGFRLAHHIRFTESLKEKRFIPIVIYSSAPFSTVFYSCELINILRTKGVYLIDLAKEAFEQHLSRDLDRIASVQELQAIARTLTVEIPKSYHDSHSLANEWGAFQLDRISGANVLNESEHPKFNHLYFKWLRHINLQSRQRDEEVIQVESRLKITLPGVKVVGKIDLSALKKR